jgi:hypothetical protein
MAEDEKETCPTYRKPLSGGMAAGGSRCFVVTVVTRHGRGAVMRKRHEVHPTAGRRLCGGARE